MMQILVYENKLMCSKQGAEYGAKLGLKTAILCENVQYLLTRKNAETYAESGFCPGLLGIFKDIKIPPY